MTKRGFPSPASHARNQSATGKPVHRDGAAQRSTGRHLAATASPSPDEEDDSFDDVPTVANRPKPALPDAGADAPPAERTPGIGAYRIVRPDTSDTLDPPETNKPQKGSRIVIGVARK
jgi:hypothetical protein